MSKKNTILISGYFGFDNAGDEAVLAAVTKLLRQRLPEARLVALAAKPERTAAALAYQGVEAIDRRNMTLLKQELKQAALFISGGGSLFQDVTSVRSVLYYASLLNTAHRAGVPCVVLAQGLGPLNTFPGRFMTKRTMEKAASICWRDEDSLALAIKIGLPEEKMFVTCDPVLLWQPFASGSLWQKGPGEPPAVGFALRPWRELAVAEVAKAIDTLQAKGYNVVLLPFHQGVDDAVLEKLNHQLKQPAAVLTGAGPKEIYRAIGGLDYLVGMRLHALIMARAENVPAGAISYDPKVESFAKWAGQPMISTWDTMNAAKIVAAVEAGLQTKVEPQQQLYQQLWQRPLTEIEAIYRQQAE